MKKIIIIFLLSIFFLPAIARATTISPLVIEVDLDPGRAIKKTISLYNETGQDLRLNGYIETFKPKGENGEAEIASALNYQALSWVGLPINAVNLKPGEVLEALVAINIPKTAQVGGYYLAVMWETAPTVRAGETPIGVSGRVGTLLLLKVKGAVQEKLEISEFSTKNNFYNHLPADFSARLKNLGNVHIKPGGYLTIENIFGRVVENLPFNNDKGNILPQSIRKFALVWQRKNPPEVSGGFWRELAAEFRQFAFGRYVAQLNLEYGESQQRISSPEIVFWVIPWRLLTILVVIILLIFLWIKIKRGE
ncbi:hypothetical protein HZA71_01985 [Candidatus Falkowbacteria bacterium]|nr:hypothetical protein [Candidatus Falkowbacteria bacterium]